MHLKLSVILNCPEEKTNGLATVDAKFPREDYERLLEAERNHEDEASKTHRKALGNVLSQKLSISEKYVQPPYTTDFAILFLPSEGLYARCLESVTLF